MKLISKSLLVVSSFLVLASCGGGGGTVVTSSETSSSETPITTSEQPVVTSEERPVVTSEEAPVITSEEKPVVTSEEAPVTTSEEKPVVTSEEQPVVTSEEKPVVTSEIPAESETPIESSEEEKEYYTITFETNGGSYVAPIQVEFNTLAAKPADPVKDGCEFLGWFKDTYCITPFDWTKHLVTADWILYAGWEGDEPVESSEEIIVTSEETPVQTSEEAGELTLTLDPGVWDSTGSPRYAVYLFKDTSNEWMDMQKNGSVYVVTLSQTQLASYNKVIFTRMNPASSENTWSNKWNQSNDLDIPSVSSTYTITGWGDMGQNSPGQWSN